MVDVLVGLFFAAGVIYFYIVILTEASLIIRLVFFAWTIAVLLNFSFVKNKVIRIISAIALTVALVYFLFLHPRIFAPGAFLNGLLIIVSVAVTFYVLWIIGNGIGSGVHNAKQRRREKRIASIQQDLLNRESMIPSIKDSYVDKKIVLDLLELLSSCGLDTESIKSRPELSSAAQLKAELDKKQTQIDRLKAVLSSLQQA